MQGNGTEKSEVEFLNICITSYKWVYAYKTFMKVDSVQLFGRAYWEMFEGMYFFNPGYRAINVSK